MSQFAAALEIVLDRLDARRASGAAEWRASRASLERLLEERPRHVVIDEPPSPETVYLATAVETMPPAAKAATPIPDQVYQPVTDPALPKAERLARLRACPERLPCGRCPYGQGAHPHIVFGVGNIDSELMFVGEAPGAEEDAQGEPFVGRAGQLLNKMIATMGYQRADIYIANILKCRPDTPGQTSGNRAPTTAEMESCRPCLYEQIEIIQPRAIVALGATAMRGLLDLAEPIGKLRGRWHDFRGIPVMATYHPSYLLRNQAPAERRKVWEDLLEVKAHLGHVITERDRSYFLTKS
jgi:uracil-DNA glycosylase family 4